MGLQQAHVIADFQQCAIMRETTAGTYVAPTAADYVKVLSTGFGFTQDPMMRDDANDGIDDYEFTEEKRDCPMTIESLIIPSGTAGTAPQHSLLYEAGFGTITDGVSDVAYTLAGSQSSVALSGIRKFHVINSILMEQFSGFVINETKFTIGGKEKPKVAFTGEAMNLIRVIRALAADTVVGASGSVLLTAPEAFGYEAGGRVAIAAQTNGGVGFTVGAITPAASGGTGTALPVSPNHAGYVTGDAITPFSPAPSAYVGSPLSHTRGSMTIGGRACPIQSADITIARNMDFVKDEFGSLGMTDAIIGRRVISLEYTIRARADFLYQLNYAKQLVAQACTMVIGYVAGRILTLSVPQATLFPSAIDIGQNGTGTMKLRGRAMASAQGALNAVTATFT